MDEILDGVYTVKFIEPETKKSKPSKPDSRIARFARNNEEAADRSKNTSPSDSNFSPSSRTGKARRGGSQAPSSMHQQSKISLASSNTMLP